MRRDRFDLGEAELEEAGYAGKGSLKILWRAAASFSA